MSGSSGLTSLGKDSFQPQEIGKISPEQMAEMKLGESRAEIDLVRRSRQDLIEEMDQLRQVSDKTKKFYAIEIGQLIAHKSKLAVEIKRLMKILGVFKESQARMVAGYNQFGEERIGFLTSLSKAMSLDIQEEVQKLDKRLAEITKEEEFWAGFAEHYTKLAEITEATASRQAQKQAELSRGYIDVASKRELAEKMAKKAGEWLVLGEDKLKQGESRLADTETKALAIEKSISDRQDRIDKLEKKLSRIDKSLASDRKYLEVQTKRLDQKEKWLEDREQTLKRVYDEIISKGGKVI